MATGRNEESRPLLSGVDESDDDEIITVENDVISCSEEGEEDYDLFISFCEKDQNELKDLFSKLEMTYGMKCMLADRDFTPGMKIDENCKIKMKRSKRVLFIITPNFVKSFWCNQEIDIALIMSSRGRRDMVIPLLFKPVRGEDLPTFLQVYTYIDATKVEDLALKIYETCRYNENMLRADKLISQDFPVSLEELREKNGARLIHSSCVKKDDSLRGVAWEFPAVPDSGNLESEEDREIYAEIRTILNRSFAFRWYGLLYDTKRLVGSCIVAMILGVIVIILMSDLITVTTMKSELGDSGDLILVCIMSSMCSIFLMYVLSNIKGKMSILTAEKRIWTYCLEKRKDAHMLAVISDGEWRRKLTALSPTERSIYETLRNENGNSEDIFPQYKELWDSGIQGPRHQVDVSRKVSDYLFSRRSTLVHWMTLPLSDVNRHNTWGGRQCVCEMFAAEYRRWKKGKRMENI